MEPGSHSEEEELYRFIRKAELFFAEGKFMSLEMEAYPCMKDSAGVYTAAKLYVSRSYNDVKVHSERSYTKWDFPHVIASEEVMSLVSSLSSYYNENCENVI